MEAKACVDCGLKKECKIDTQYRNNCLYRRFSKSAPAKSCETCKFKFKDGVRCVIDPTNCGSYKSKSPDKVHNTVTYLPSQFNPVPDIPDEVLEDTVLTKGQIAKSLEVSIAGVLNMDLKLAKDADAHTRRELKKQGYKSPEEVQAIRSGIAKRLQDCHDTRDGLQDLERKLTLLIKELEESCQKES